MARRFVTVGWLVAVACSAPGLIPVDTSLLPDTVDRVAVLPQIDGELQPGTALLPVRAGGASFDFVQEWPLADSLLLVGWPSLALHDPPEDRARTSPVAAAGAGPSFPPPGVAIELSPGGAAIGEGPANLRLTSDWHPGCPQCTAVDVRCTLCPGARVAQSGCGVQLDLESCDRGSISLELFDRSPGWIESSGSAGACTASTPGGAALASISCQAADECEIDLYGPSPPPPWVVEAELPSIGSAPILASIQRGDEVLLLAAGAADCTGQTSLLRVTLDPLALASSATFAGCLTGLRELPGGRLLSVEKAGTLLVLDDSAKVVAAGALPVDGALIPIDLATSDDGSLAAVLFTDDARDLSAVIEVALPDLRVIRRVDLRPQRFLRWVGGRWLLAGNNEYTLLAPGEPLGAMHECATPPAALSDLLVGPGYFLFTSSRVETPAILKRERLDDAGPCARAGMFESQGRPNTLVRWGDEVIAASFDFVDKAARLTRVDPDRLRFVPGQLTIGHGPAQLHALDPARLLVVLTEEGRLVMVRRN